MSLRKSPTLTSAFLAAQRRNARKCTGPRTAAGKARSSLNSLKGGRFAHGLPERMRAAGVGGLDGISGFRRRMLWLFDGKDAPILAERMANTMAISVWRRNKVRRKRPAFRIASESLRLSPEQIEEIRRWLASFPAGKSEAGSNVIAAPAAIDWLHRSPGGQK